MKSSKFSLLFLLFNGVCAISQTPLTGIGFSNNRVMGFYNWPIYHHPFKLNSITGTELLEEISSAFQMYWSVPNISDQNGNLLFFANGARIGQTDSTLLVNGDSIGIFLNNLFWTYYPTELVQGAGFNVNGAIILPHPGDSLRWDYFSSPQEFIPNFTDQPMHVYHAIIEKDSLGMFSVTSKNHSLITDTISGSLAACKHANGRDWWIITNEFDQPRYFAWLLTPDSIYSYQFPLDGPACVTGGQHVFSNNGKYYSLIGSDCKLRVYEFDRCSGQLFNLRMIPQVEPNTWYFNSAFSRNDKYLYFCNLDKCFQWDLEEPNLQSAITVIADESGTQHYDTTFGFPINFFFTVPVNDGRIEVVSTSTVRTYSWIDNPDTTWNAVGFHPFEGQHPFANGMTATYHPNYLLGPEAGTVCDSLTIITGNNFKKALQVNIVPNPAGNMAIVRYEPPRDRPGQLYLRSSEGRLLLQRRIPQWTTQQIIEVDQLNNGLYFVELTADGRSWNGKLIVLKP